MNQQIVSEYCDLCRIVTDQKIIYDPFRLEVEYFSGASINDLEFILSRCKICGVVKTTPSLSDEEMEPYYSLQSYSAHHKLQQDLTGTLSPLERIRNFITTPFFSIFFGPDSARSRFAKRVLTSALFPRMFRGLPLLIVCPNTLLDIGCGDGAFLHQLSGTKCQGSGIDLSPRAVETAKLAGLDVRLVNIEDKEINLDGPYDVIRMGDVLEHTMYPGRLLDRVYELLSPGGELIIHVPNFDALSRYAFGIYWSGLCLPFHRYHFNQTSLETALRQRGFDIGASFTKNTLQFLYSVEHRMHHGGIRLKIVNTLTRLLETPLDVLLDLIFWRKGDGLEIHAIKRA